MLSGKSSQSVSSTTDCTRSLFFSHHVEFSLQTDILSSIISTLQPHCWLFFNTNRAINFRFVTKIFPAGPLALGWSFYLSLDTEKKWKTHPSWWLAFIISNFLLVLMTYCIGLSLKRNINLSIGTLLWNNLFIF